MSSAGASSLPDNLPSLPVGVDLKLLFLSEIPWPPPPDYQPDLNGKCATAKQGPHEPIEVAPLGSDPHLQQTWRFENADERKQYYIRPALDGSGLGFHNEMDTSPGIPLTLSDPSVFMVPVIYETPEGDLIAIIQPRDTYTMIPTASKFYVTVSQHNDTIEVKDIDVTLPNSPVPAWLITTRK
ncbi:peptidase inhibitor clitocypin domain-containing protein [Ceratobasidium sp. AG-Ba]|nr:peptidase inhibitor clitocypin domain-containing protein [Ceratobasidium sp. AG-Ba]